MNRKRWMILAVCMLVLLSLAACGKADGGDDSGAAALESALRQVRDKLDEAKHDEAESGSTAGDSEPEPEKTPEPAAAEPEQSAVERIELTRVPSGGDEYAVITGYDAAENTVWSFETPRFVMTEMTSVVELGQRDDRYYSRIRRSCVWMCRPERACGRTATMRDERRASRSAIRRSICADNTARTFSRCPIRAKRWRGSSSLTRIITGPAKLSFGESRRWSICTAARPIMTPP